MGTHMLTYRAQHFDGLWHGGYVLGTIHEKPKLPLEEALGKMARTNPAENARAFSYAAHPLSGIGWNAEQLDMAMTRRSREFVNGSAREFVFKGIQVWNSKEERKLPMGDGDFGVFANLNPWTNATWRQGDANWDGETWGNELLWMDRMSMAMLWAFDDQPRVQMIRKLYGVAGTDAHGDLNYTESRAAAKIHIPSTYSVNTNAWGRVRTLVFARDIAGASDGDRLIEAMASGSGTMTDGPALKFTIDASTRWDSDKMVWDQRRPAHKNDDGLMGGTGAYDGARTALVVANDEMAFGYHYRSTAEFDGHRSPEMRLYRVEAGRVVPRATVAGRTIPKAFRSLPAPEAYPTKTVSRFDHGKAGGLTVPTAYFLSAYTGGDPESGPLPVESYRAITNPVWVVPVRASGSAANGADDVLPPGALEVRFEFPISMKGDAPRIAVKALAGSGRTTDASQAPLAVLQPIGWSEANGTTTAVYRAKNSKAIPLSALPRFVRGKVSLVAYFLDAPRDVNGNALNRIAIRIDVALRHPENGLPSPGAALAPSAPSPSVAARIDPDDFRTLPKTAIQAPIGPDPVPDQPAPASHVPTLLAGVAAATGAAVAARRLLVRR